MKQWILFFSLTVVSATQAFAAGFDFRVVGGTDATEDQAPFIVSLRDYADNHYCGGTFISKEWVVTAAHCIIYGGKPVNVKTHLLDVQGNEGTKTLKVLSVHTHPQFNKLTANGSDVALLKVESYPEAKTAVLNDLDITNYSTTTFQVAGWGNQQEWGNTADVLQIVDVPYVNQATCESQFQDERPSSKAYLDNTMFCAGYDAGMKDACQGDSGGPLFTYDSSTQKHILVGIVSWGYGCARPNLSGVYSNVSELKQWIKETSQL